MAGWWPQSPCPALSTARPAPPGVATPRQCLTRPAPSKPLRGNDDVRDGDGRAGVGVVALLHGRSDVEGDVVLARSSEGVLPGRVLEVALLLGGRRPGAV